MTLEDYRRILAISQAGLMYAHDEFDKERYTELKQISLNLLSQLSEEPIGVLKQLTEENEGYPTPKVDVRAYIKNDVGHILLVEDKRSKEWALPGGFAEVGFSPKENIIKEVQEETGLDVVVDELMAIFDTNQDKDTPQLFQYYKLVFSCCVTGGAFKENSETSNIGYFAIEQLPPLSVKRTNLKQLLTLEKMALPYIDD